MFMDFVKAFFGVVAIALICKLLIALSVELFICVLIAGAIAYFTNWVGDITAWIVEWFEGLSN